MPNTREYLPRREAELLSWSRVFNQQINDAPEAYGLSAEQATNFSALFDAFATAFATANDPATRTRPAIIVKNERKKAMVTDVRRLVAIVRSAPGVTNGQLVELGLRVHDEDPAPVSDRIAAPMLTIRATVGRSVRIRLKDRDHPDNAGKPKNIFGASIFSYVGPTPPSSLREWTFEKNTTRVRTEVYLPPSVPAGSQVWLIAFWINTCGESSPTSAAQTTNISGGGLRIAA